MLRISSRVFSLIYLFILGLHLQHIKVSRLGLELELQLLACATATAMLYLSHVCDLHHSSQHHWILNPLSEARDWTHTLMDISWVCDPWAMMGTPMFFFFPDICLSSLKKCLLPTFVIVYFLIQRYMRFDIKLIVCCFVCKAFLTFSVLFLFFLMVSFAV